MKRFVVITVGKTHSGKTTFAKMLEQQLPDSIVIDQDNHAEFINTHYNNLRPKHGPNTLKFVITQTIVDYAIHQTPFHLILSNSNRVRTSRLELIANFRNKGFTTILVLFDLPDHVLRERVATSQRSKAIFRSAASFEEVLNRQLAESSDDVAAPLEGEAEHLFVIHHSDEVLAVIRAIVNIAHG